MVGLARVRGLLAIAALLAVAASCDGGPQVTMMHLTPSADWEARLLADRELKDDYMRSAPDTPLRPEDVPTFSGLDYWPPQPEHYRVGQVEYYPQPEALQLATTAGELRPGEKVGWISFELDGAVYRLQVYRMLDSGPGGGFFLPFRDQTAGHETYPSGRYLELDGPEGGPYVLDFNRAYNPYCAYGAPERFACPVTPRENHLDLAIRAGERGYKHGGAG